MPKSKGADRQRWRVKDPNHDGKKMATKGNWKLQTEKIREDEAVCVEFEMCGEWFWYQRLAWQHVGESAATGWLTDAQISVAPPCYIFHSSWILCSLSPSHINLNCQRSLTETYVVFEAQTKPNELLSLAKARLSRNLRSTVTVHHIGIWRGHPINSKCKSPGMCAHFIFNSKTVESRDF